MTFCHLLGKVWRLCDVGYDGIIINLVVYSFSCSLFLIKYFKKTESEGINLNSAQIYARKIKFISPNKRPPFYIKAAIHHKNQG